MVRFINAVVTILGETTSIDDSGDCISEWSAVEVIKGDVQPHTMTEDEVKAYGISTSRGNVRLFLYNGYHPNVKVGNRASVQSDFTGTTEIFNIMPINAWSKHGECLLVPVENEAEQTEDSTEENGAEESGEDD